MTQDNLAHTIRELAVPLAAGLGLDIWGIELVFGGRSLVRIFVETQGGQPLSVPFAQGRDGSLPEARGVSIDQCAELSRLLGLTLEVEDIIPGAYVLEVSSPGLDRVFFTESQLAGAVGGTIDVTLHAPLPEVPARRKFRGLLKAAPAPGQEGALFTLQAEDVPKPGQSADVSFAFSDVKKARQVWLPPEKKLPGKGPRTRDGKGKAKTPPQAPESPDE